MPTYEYQCTRCGHNFDELQSFSDPPLKKCPKCRKNGLQRLFGTGAAVLFKGAGFYQTDYRSESYKASAKADSDGAGKSKTSDNGTTGSDKTAKPAKSAQETD